MPEFNPTVTYSVSLPIEHTDALADFLRERGVNFNPRMQALAFNESDNGDTPLLMGYEAKEILPAVNRFLEERDMGPQVPGSPEELTMAQLHEFLELAVSHFNWENGQGPTGAWWLDEGTPWSEIIQGFPTLFPGAAST